MSDAPAHHTFLRACQGLPVSHTPVWLMRQAGRYMAEYRALRQQQGILDMIKNPETAAEVTMQPARAFPVDAAIIFADILTLLEPMGLNLEFQSGRGPIFHNPVRDAAAVRALRPVDPVRDLGFTLEALRITRQLLADRIPLIGFSGAPFTLACYAIEGGGSKDFDAVRAWFHRHPAAVGELMDKLADAVSVYLIAQAEAGAQALQLFDSWAGCLSLADYRRFAAPWTRRVFATVAAATDVPLIHFSANGGHLLDEIATFPCQVLGLDWRVDAAAAIERHGRDRAYQGNFDPARLLADDDTIREGARETLAAFAGARGHIFNLGHGVIKTTDPEKVRLLIDEVHRLTRRG